MGLHVVRNPGETTSRTLLILQRGKPRSKYYDLVCFCRRTRKDGTCKTTRLFLEQHIRPEARNRVRVEHPRAGGG
jgi:hypothetical protein